MTIRLLPTALVALASVVSLSRANAPAASLEFVDVFVAGDGGYHTYRIPSIVATRSGTLLAFAEGRRTGAGDAGDVDLVLRRSHDSGRSWSPMQVLSDIGPDTAGSPCAVVDRRTGSVWLISTRNRGADREQDILAGGSHGGQTIWAMKSDDDGITWSMPVEITKSVKRPDWTWYATGPGIGIQTATGRIVIPANHAETDGTYRSHLFFSDDGGAHWSLGAASDPGTNESQVVELADGRLLLTMRNHPPKAENFRLVATSKDGGVSLSTATPDRALIEPPAQASLVRLSTEKDGGRNRLLFANPASTKRERMTIRLSDDEGTTWPVARVVYAGPSAYSSLVALPDASIGLLFERGERSPYERITFVHATLEWLTETGTQ
jgi:sialidase-1